jgi:hypothetical protein
MRLLLPIIPLTAALLAIRFRSIPVRIVSIAVILIATTALFGAFIASARLAEEITGARQGSEWWQGAADAQAVIRTVMRPLLSTLAALALIAAVPRSVRTNVD